MSHDTTSPTTDDGPTADDRPTVDDPADHHAADYDYTGGAVERPGLVADLTERVEGDVRFDSYTRELYATDASVYEQLPVGVVAPQSTADVAAVVDYCADREIPVLPRGGGTSLAGQAVNEAVVLDLKRYMDAFREVDPEAGTATAQPGITLARLNDHLEEHGLKYAPDPAWGDKSVLGGCIGNNSTGAHSLKYEKADGYVESVEAVLADGTVATFGWVDVDELHAFASGSEGEDAGESDAAESDAVESDATFLDTDSEIERRVYQTVARILAEEAAEIDAQFPDLTRNVSGYNLDRLLADARERGAVNVGRLLAGSEGTLAVVTEATVLLEPIPEATAVALLTYDGVVDAMRDVAPILDHDPAAVEVMDDVLLDLARDTEEFGELVGTLPEGTNATLLVEFYGDSDDDARASVERLLADRLPEQSAVAPPAGDAERPSGGAQTASSSGDTHAVDALEAYDDERQAKFWKMRKAGLPILLSRTDDEKHWPFVEDTAVPAEHLPEYVAELQTLFEEHDTFAAYYAHAGPGVLHIRPLLNLKTESGVEAMREIAAEVTDLVVEYGGSVSGEHGDGRARSKWNRKLYGERLWETFRELKTAFDPDWIFNPGTVCGEPDPTEDLRFDPDYEFDPGFEPTLNWETENGFQGMTELCHGCAGCTGHQDTTGGVMCPTYRATGEEITSTRGRANMLRQAMSGDLPADVTDEEFVTEVLDLCIGCKGCRVDCPSGVDMAKLKAEVTHQYHQEEGVSLRDRLFANVETVLSLGSTFAPLSNWAMSVPGSGWLLEQTVGIARDRQLPAFSRETFRDWFDARGGAAVDPAAAERRVLLIADPYTNYSHPDVGKAAVRVLEAAGVHVRVPADVSDSGRPAFSKAMLDRARETAAENVATLAPRVRDGWDVVTVEPSDAVMYQLDYEDLLTGAGWSSNGVTASDADRSSSGVTASDADRSSSGVGASDADGSSRSDAAGAGKPSGSNAAGAGGPSGSDASDVSVVADRTYGVCEYVDHYRLDEQIAFDPPAQSLAYHGHCQQKATRKDHHAVGVLRRAGYEVDAVDSGCCGMAGSFGYEAEHRSLSGAIADVLFDQLDDSPAEQVVAPGASCRSQLVDYGADAEPPHPIQSLADAVDS